MHWKSDRVSILCLALALHAFYLNFRVYNLELALEQTTRHLLPHHSTARKHEFPTQQLRGDSFNKSENVLALNVSGHRHSISPEEPSASEWLAVKSPPAQIPPQSTESKSRGMYGGTQDLEHLGGFTSRDNGTISPNLWNFLLSEVAVHSMVDVGCGRGYSTKYFLDRGAEVLCVEGSHDALKQSLLPRSAIVQHDFTRGAWWPNRTFDFAWSTEFLEHVGRQYMDNYMATFHRSALIAVTSSGWGGWHHVEVHAPWWWIARFEARGFLYSSQLTNKFRSMIEFDKSSQDLADQLKGLLVFLNPKVARLSTHKHLFGGHGCFDDEKNSVDNEGGGTACTGVDSLPHKLSSLMQCRRHRDETKENPDPFETRPWVCDTSLNNAVS